MINTNLTAKYLWAERTFSTDLDFVHFFAQECGFFFTLFGIFKIRLYFIRLIIMSVSRMATGYNIIIENQCDYPFFLSLLDHSFLPHNYRYWNNQSKIKLKCFSLFYNLLTGWLHFVWWCFFYFSMQQAIRKVVHT